MTQAYIGLGANVGDAVQHILDAKQQLLLRLGSAHSRMSSLYLSSPLGYTDQPDFVNAVLRISAPLTAFELLVVLQQVEANLGRVRDPSNRNAPRTIDLDLLLFGDQVIDTEELTVPHPRMFKRRFVLEPLTQVLDPQHPQANAFADGCQLLRESRDQKLYVIEC